VNEEEKGGGFECTQWLDWITPMTQKRTLTLRKKRVLANRRGWW